MAELAAITKELDFHLEQVQDFTPTPMTVATEIYYTGYHPYTGEKVYTAKTEKEKLAQRSFFFWYKPENRQSIVSELRRMNRPDHDQGTLSRGCRKSAYVRQKSAGISRGQPRQTQQKKRTA